MNEPDNNSYGQILKSSSIIGGARLLNLVIGMVRTKFVAMFIGPSGIGLVSLYQSAIGLTGTLSGLGIGQSGVRQVAEAKASEDRERIGRSVKALRRTCWFTGLLGTAVTSALAWPLSTWTFGTPERAWAVAILGLTLLMGTISGGQTALLQGARRIGDLARVNVFSVVAGTLVSIGLYAYLGERGIVAVLLINAAANLAFSWWFSRRLAVPEAALTWRETVGDARRLVSLGAAFMWSALLVAGFDLGVRGLIVRGFGTDAAGIYQAAWAISGVFAGFILDAMGADFYPRLTAVAGDNQRVNRLVNEQTEIGILLALCGLLGTLVFSPWIIRIFYTPEFSEAAGLLPWFVLGIFGRVISWPLGFILLAKGVSLWFVATETISIALHLALVWFGLSYFGLKGVAVAFAALYGFYTLGMLRVASRLSGFRWSREVVRLLGIGSAVVLATFLLQRLIPEVPSTIAGSLIVAGCAWYCLRQIVLRIGREHRISRLVLRIPLLGSRIGT